MKINTTRNLSFLFLIFSFLICFSPVFSEGSQNYNAGSDGNRSSLVWQQNLFYAYLQAGEKMYIGTAVYKNSDYDVQVITPAGVTTNYDVTKTSNGFIKNRAQELAGPNTITSGGYKPITVSAAEEGIYRIIFWGNKTATKLDSGCGMSVTADWYIDAGCIRASKPAWDITVANQSGARVNGRVFANILNMALSVATYTSFYVLRKPAGIPGFSNPG